MTSGFVAKQLRHEAGAIRVGTTRAARFDRYESGRPPWSRAFWQVEELASAAIYIGDGMSVASFVGTDEFRSLASSLVAQRVAVTSYAIGPRLDNNPRPRGRPTGGMLAIDGEGVDVKQAAVFLLERRALHGRLADAGRLAQVVCRSVPGRNAAAAGRSRQRDHRKGATQRGQQINMTAEVAGKPVEMTWTVTPGESNEDYSFLPLLVDSAKKDRGVTLPTVGTVGLKETGRLVSSSASRAGPPGRSGRGDGQSRQCRTAGHRSFAARSARSGCQGHAAAIAEAPQVGR